MIKGEAASLPSIIKGEVTAIDITTGSPCKQTSPFYDSQWGKLDQTANGQKGIMCLHHPSNIKFHTRSRDLLMLGIQESTTMIFNNDED